MPNQHEMIAASAGSGKTFALASRLIRLIARDRRPQRIIALTFSRAAAGEIFDKLVTRLAAAAQSPQNARKEAVANLQMPDLTQGDFKQILRDVITSMHLSPIGTLDSFFVRILKAFPFEFGITGSFAILDDHALKIERDRLFRDVLQTGHDDPSRLHFLEAFKRATFGTQLKSVWTSLDAFTKQTHYHYLEAPDPSLWGRPEAIWPDGCPWLDGTPADATAEAEALRNVIRGGDYNPSNQTFDPYPDDVRQRWETFIRLAESFTPQSAATLSNLSSADSYLLDRLLTIVPDLQAGQAFLKIGRFELFLGPDFCQHAYALLRHIVRCILETKFESTQGLYEILHRYETAYAKRLRQAGKLTFSDVTVLLANAGDDDGPMLTLNPSAAVNRLDIDYRLDGQFDHWALDEFQDTSRRQWQVVRNLIDEVVQDTSETRSFFAVGDVKQAIYGWRGGDSSLMGEILEEYNQESDGPIATSTLSLSWRSSQRVLDAVNGVFASLDRIPDLPEAVRERWRDKTVWHPHQAALDKPGYATLLEVPYEKGASAAEAKEKRYRAMVSQLQRTRPWQHGLSTAVLVRGNKTGREVADYLRQHGIPVAWDGDLAIADNPVVAAFLSLLNFAEHPGDTFAWQHLQMTPLRTYLPGTGTQAKSRTCRDLLRLLYAGGFEAVIQTWWQKVQSSCQDDPFTNKRMDELLEAARVFDADGNRNGLDFVEFVKSYTVREHPSDRLVRVMTMHHSKGLGFDVVILPELQPANGSGMTSLGQLGVSIDLPRHGRQANWVLDMPQTKVVQADPVLNDHLQRRQESACFEELCLLYVAMTRAKHALYMIASQPGPSSKSIHMATVLSACLATAAAPRQQDGAAVLYEDGKPDWIRTMPPPQETSPEVSSPWLTVPVETALPRRQRFRRRLPSAHAESGVNAASLFAAKSRRRLEFGSALHALFEQTEWADSEPPEAVIQRWRKTICLHPSVADAVELAYRQALAFPQVRSALLRPDTPTPILWREKRFEMILDEEWISGTIDRAVICLDPDGKPASASILDFKSDRVQSPDQTAQAAQRYAPQLHLYRRVLSRLTGLPTDRIAADLLFTSTGQVVRSALP